MRIRSALIIDDNKTTREILREVLEEQGIVVDSCERGLAAIDLVNNYCFDLVLIDYFLPDLTGDEVIRYMKQRCHSTFIVGLSVDDRKNDFLASGADAFVHKFDMVQHLALLTKNGQLQNTFH